MDKSYYERNKEKLLQRAKEYYNNNKEKYAEYWRDNKKVRRKYQTQDEQKHKHKWRNNKTKYNITENDYDILLTEQQNKCAICQIEMHKPHIDHCHTTGKVRGLLCQLCNQGLGHFKDNTDALQRAVNYLNRHNDS